MNLNKGANHHTLSTLSTSRGHRNPKVRVTAIAVFAREVRQLSWLAVGNPIPQWVWVKIRYPNNWMVNTTLD